MSAVAFRNPDLLADTARKVNHISAGRLPRFPGGPGAYFAVDGIRTAVR